MSTPSERQGMARALALAATEGHGYRAGDCLILLAHVVTGRPETSFDTAGEELHAICTTLAGLVDPTCRSERVTADTTAGRAVIGTKCSECHTIWMEPSRVRYCPNCGARVVVR